MTTHQEQTKLLASLSGATLAQTDLIIRGFLESHATELRLAGRTRLRGIGVLELVKRKPKLARNPRTGEPVLIAARLGVRFRKSSMLGL
jgi:nucleoid DNA-binding protein